MTAINLQWSKINADVEVDDDAMIMTKMTIIYRVLKIIDLSKATNMQSGLMSEINIYCP